MSETRKHHREICSLCNEVSRVGFHVPNEIWELAVHRSQINNIICLRCFTRLADERSVEWDREVKFYPVSQRRQAVTRGETEQLEQDIREAIKEEINTATPLNHVLLAIDHWHKKRGIKVEEQP